MDQYKKLKKLIDKGHAVLLEIKDTKLAEYSKFRLVTKTSSEFTFYKVVDSSGDDDRKFKYSCFMNDVNLNSGGTDSMIRVMRQYDKSFDGKIVKMQVLK